jgi:hypothetical protein
MCHVDVMFVCELKENTSSVFFNYGMYKPNITRNTLDPTLQEIGIMVSTALPPIM